MPGNVDWKVDAMTTPADQASDRLSFGPFSLVASERLLTKDGVPRDLRSQQLICAGFSMGSVFKDALICLAMR